MSRPERRPAPREELAVAGEQVAQRHLEASGMRVLARRVRTPFGEVDLLAEQGRTVVFVEVKTRRGSSRGEPAEAVGARKSEHLRRSALHLLSRRRELRDRPCRFDVVEVRWPPGGEPEVRRIEDALDGGRWA